MTTSGHQRSISRAALWRVALLAVALAIVSILGYRLGWFDLQRITALVARLRSGNDIPTAGAIFLAIYALAIAIGFPALPFTVAGGAIFGHLLGAALSWTGAVIGSLLGYLIARSIGRESARRWLMKKSRGAALTKSTSFLALMRIRLVPFVPLSVVNYAAGLAHMRVSTFVAATAAGIIPVTLLFAYFADSLVRGLHDAKTDAYRNVAIACGALIALSLAPMLLRWWAKRQGRAPNGSR